MHNNNFLHLHMPKTRTVFLHTIEEFLRFPSKQENNFCKTNVFLPKNTYNACVLRSLTCQSAGPRLSFFGSHSIPCSYHHPIPIGFDVPLLARISRHTGTIALRPLSVNSIGPRAELFAPIENHTNHLAKRHPQLTGYSANVSLKLSTNHCRAYTADLAPHHCCDDDDGGDDSSDGFLRLAELHRRESMSSYEIFGANFGESLGDAFGFRLIDSGGIKMTQENNWN